MGKRIMSLLVAGLLASSAPVVAQPPVVVELFTSEGCSSCPPAEAYLTELARRGDVIALAMHVDYWDGLGWKDPFSLSAASERQQHYAARFGRGSYTPQIVIDGSVGLVGSDRQAVAAAIEHPRSDNSAPTIAMFASGTALSIQIGAGAAAGDIVLVGFDPRHETAVLRGENMGRTLIESNAVRSLNIVGRWTGQAKALSVRTPAGERAAVLLQADDGRILAAAQGADPR